MRRGGHALDTNGRYNVFCQRRTRRTRSFFFNQQITQITQIIFLPMEIIFANGEHEGHEIFFSQQIFIANGELEEHEVFIWSTDYTDYTEN